jgi:general stress protein 26
VDSQGDRALSRAFAELVEMSEKDSIDRVWDVIEKVGVCMLTTQFVGGLRARPLEARPDRDAGVIFFVTDIHSTMEAEIEATPDIGLVFIDPKDKVYLSITGRARVLRDIEKTKAAWRKTDEVWWPGGPSDPNVCLLRIEPSTAELWDGPASAVVTAFEFAKARLTGEEPKLGENRKVTVKM